MHHPFSSPEKAKEYWTNTIENTRTSPMFKGFDLSSEQVENTVRKILDAGDLQEHWQQMLGSLLLGNPNTMSKLRVARTVYDFIGDDEPEEEPIENDQQEADILAGVSIDDNS